MPINMKRPNITTLTIAPAAIADKIGRTPSTAIPKVRNTTVQIRKSPVNGMTSKMRGSDWVRGFAGLFLLFAEHCENHANQHHQCTDNGEKAQAETVPLLLVNPILT